MLGRRYAAPIISTLYTISSIANMHKIETSRLLLRQWRDSDLEPFYRINSDADVMRYFPSILSREESDSMAERCKGLIEDRGWGFWPVERKHDGQFLGFVGLHVVRQELPFSPSIEIGWRLRKDVWQQGIATEAALACLEFGFDILLLDEIVSFTSVKNIPSIGVMKKIGMHDSGFIFEHPFVDSNTGLAEHCLYKLTKYQWCSQ